MLRTRALAFLTAASCAAAALTACERSATAPQGPRVSGVATMAATEEPAASSALVDLQGGILELRATQGYPLHSTLTVPAGVLDLPSYFDVTREVTPAALVLRVSGRPAEELASMTPTQNLSDEPIVLALRNTGTAPRAISVVFSGPDGSDPLTVGASLDAGQTTTFGFRRGRSKYSVIIF